MSVSSAGAPYQMCSLHPVPGWESSKLSSPTMRGASPASNPIAHDAANWMRASRGSERLRTDRSGSDSGILQS
jgi:hypothetical protein